MILCSNAPQTTHHHLSYGNAKMDERSTLGLATENQWQKRRIVERELTTNETTTELKFPTNVAELRRLQSILHEYSVHRPSYVLALFGSAYLFKQTFAIPGSVFMNILAGSIYGVWIGFPLCCLLTASGATACYALSALAGGQLVQRYAGTRLERFRRKIYESRDSGDMLQILISLRLFPATPNWLLNIASPLVGVPVPKFFLSVFIGLMPYNFMCVQAGSLLMSNTEADSLDDLFGMKTMFSLLTIAAAFTAPIVWRRWRPIKM